MNRFRQKTRFSSTWCSLRWGVLVVSGGLAVVGAQGDARGGMAQGAPAVAPESEADFLSRGGAGSPESADASVRLETFSSHSRLSFRVDSGFTPVWRDVPGGFELRFAGLGLSDLGAPLGGEKEWTRAVLPRLRDSRLEAVTLSETEAGVVVRGKWRFPRGKARPYDARMDRFEFREDAEPRYVVDFWPRKGPTVAEVEAIRAREKREAARRQAALLRKQRQERRLASAAARAEAEDLLKHCEQPLSPERDVFLAFQPVHERPKLDPYFAIGTPDEGLEYPLPESGRPESRYARLALSLYQAGKPALALRTLEFFNKDHPGLAPEGSETNELFRFLRANALLKLGHGPEALALLRELARLGGKGELAFRAALYLAASAYRTEDHPAALELFTRLVDQYPKHPKEWIFRLALAESSFAIRSYDQAAKDYQWVAVNAPGEASRAQGALRAGDLYLARQQYERALASYFQGLRRHEREAASFPGVHLNRAEALYWVEDFARAQEAFRSFLEKYPSHPEGWRAQLRLGEILARSPEPAVREGARAAFLETINRFPLSPGGTLARLRLLPCGDHGGLDLRAAESFFEKDLKNFGVPSVSLERFADWRSLARVRTLAALAPAERVVDVAIEELAQAPLSPQARETLVSHLGAVFRRAVLELAEGAQPFRAIQFYEARAEKLPPLDAEPDYLLKLSQAAADLGFTKLSLEIAQRYAQASEENARRGRAPAAEPGEIEARIARAEAEFTEAKALWTELLGAIASGDGLKVAADKVRRIDELLLRVPQEAGFSYERELMRGRLAEWSGKPAEALQHALQAQLLRSASDAADEPRLGHWIAGLHARAGSKAKAAEIFAGLQALTQEARKADGKASALGLPPVRPEEALLLAEADLWGELGKWEKAARAYGRAIERGLGGTRALYEFARAVERSPGTLPAEKEKAKKALEKAAGSAKADFWGKLAGERLLASERGEPKGSNVGKGAGENTGK